jgi:hypothetical protein
MKPKRPTSSTKRDRRNYEQAKRRAIAASQVRTLAGQDIGALPPIRDPQRRAKADADFRFFCESYFPRLFTLAWSADHLKIITKIEAAVLRGGLFAMAMPRGSGKTSLCQTAALWAMLTGRQQFVFLIAATAEYASSALANLKSHLSQNERLLEDYPEAVFPIRCLEGESRRCSGQRYYGRQTHIGWTADQIVLPTIPGSRCSGAIVHTSGLLGNVRGAMYIRPDGTSVRPSLVVIDDPQTDQSARSPAQIHERLAVVNGAILNLAGPGRKIAAVMPCTVIRQGDVADVILDRQKHSEWQGERTKLVYQFPTNQAMWDRYAELRGESMRADGDGHEATEFYRENRAAMDDGAVIAWPARHNADELSAIQHAMNLRLRDEAAFWAEYQNEPKQEQQFVEALNAVAIAQRCGGYERGRPGPDTELLTAFVDCGQYVLWWMVCGWGDGFDGRIIDYGCWPRQRVAFVTSRSANPTLEQTYPGGPDAALHAGLTALASELLGRQWIRTDGATLPLSRVLIDCGFKTDIVRMTIARHAQRGLILPSKGQGIGPQNTPISDYRRRPGEKLGRGWVLGQAGTDRLRLLRYDTNLWKTHMAASLQMPVGTRGAITLFGDRPAQHELVSLHLSAEYPTMVEARGVALNVWQARPDRENHWLDCLVGCAVGASLQGINPVAGLTKPTATAGPRLTLAEAARNRRVFSAGRVVNTVGR